MYEKNFLIFLLFQNDSIKPRIDSKIKIVWLDLEIRMSCQTVIDYCCALGSMQTQIRIDVYHP